MDKIIRFLKNLLLGSFVVMLGLAYYELVDKTTPVTLYLDANKKPLMKISVDMFFYVPAVFMVLVNVFVSMIVRIFKQIPVQRLKVANADFWNEDEDRRELLQKIFVAWIYGFAFIINFFVTMIVGKTWFVNRGIGGQLWEYGVISLCFLSLMLVWLFGIFYRLKLRREEFFVSKEAAFDDED
ncbi:MAG: hypothetical protein EAZ85_01495 [Bacteroidetes bacterium]|nr:MAG: hypothetical protein EAZ85_01495 [Bacteroidota bacterium]TAG87945.1 MAG: hypothetical protein EAZ20_09545 [Bacteroidota bacterium]